MLMRKLLSNKKRTVGIMKNSIFKMDKTMKKYMFTLIASVMATAAMAQGITPQEERIFFQKAYDVINVYAQSASVDDDRNVMRFTDLFERQDLQICNDLMSLSYEPTLPVADYVKLLREADMVTVAVRNVQKLGEIADAGEAWQLQLAFEKSISFVSQCNTLFDSREFFGHDYRLIATLSMDKSSGECRIVGLDADGKVEPFPKDYRVLCKRDERDNNLTLNGSFVKFVMDQKLLRPTDKLSYRGAPVTPVDMPDQCDHKVYAPYNDKTWRLRIGGSFAVSGFNKLGDGAGITTSGDSEMGFGLDVGYVFNSKSHLRVGVFAGVGLSVNNLTMEMADGDYHADVKEDIDGDSYQRVYSVGKPGIRQELSATDIAIPLYADLEYEFNSYFSLYGDLGLKAQTSSGQMKVNVDNYATKGFYSKYDNLLIENIPELGFGNRSSKDVEMDESGATSGMTIDALLGLGLRININKSFAFDAGVQYQMGGQSWKSNKGESVFSYSGESNAKDKVNVLRRASGISHNALKVSASLIYKF